MTWPDYSILAITLISLLVGAFRGFVVEVLSLLIWAAAFFVAYQYGGSAAAMMEEQVTLPSARAAIGFTGLFIAVLLAGGLLTYLIGRLVESTGLSGTDRLLGGMFGAARGIVIVVGSLLVCGFTPIPADPWWQQSAVIARLMPLVHWASGYLPEQLREQLDFSPAAARATDPVPGSATRDPGGQADRAG